MKVAKATKGGLRSLTYLQRDRLLRDLVAGATNLERTKLTLGSGVVGDDENAIMDILRTAPVQDAKMLIAHIGWSALHDNKN
jgi:hypothetical protein